MDISTLQTILYWTMGVSVFMALFYLISTVAIIWLLQDIRSEIRTLNDNTIDNASVSSPSRAFLTERE